MKLKIPELNKNQLIFLGVALVLIIAVVVVVWVNWNKLKSWVSSKQEAADYDRQIIKSDVTLTDQQAKAIASKMYYAMKGIGTNTENLYASFRMLGSYSDLVLVMKYFSEVAGEGESLADWISDDCNSNEIAKINSILASKSINFSF